MKYGYNDWIIPELGQVLWTYPNGNECQVGDIVLDLVFIVLVLVTAGALRLVRDIGIACQEEQARRRELEREARQKRLAAQRARLSWEEAAKPVKIADCRRAQREERARRRAQ